MRSLLNLLYRTVATIAYQCVLYEYIRYIRPEAWERRLGPPDRTAASHLASIAVLTAGPEVVLNGAVGILCRRYLRDALPTPGVACHQVRTPLTFHRCASWATEALAAAAAKVAADCTARYRRAQAGAVGQLAQLANGTSLASFMGWHRVCTSRSLFWGSAGKGCCMTLQYIGSGISSIGIATPPQVYYVIIFDELSTAARSSDLLGHYEQLQRHGPGAPGLNPPGERSPAAQPPGSERRPDPNSVLNS